MADSVGLMIIIAGALHVDPQERSAYLEATFDVAGLARAFPGCADFVQAADPIDPSRINVYERWENDADVAAFRASGPPETADEAKALPEIVSADVRRFRISSVEAP